MISVVARFPGRLHPGDAKSAVIYESVDGELTRVSHATESGKEIANANQLSANARRSASHDLFLYFPSTMQRESQRRRMFEETTRYYHVIL